MLKIGITGGIGSGKTTVCHIFELFGIPVFYADDEAKKLMVTDEILIKEVKNEFGSISYSNNGDLNRKHIADVVFKDKNQLNKLNSFVHPAVFRAMDKWSERQKSPYVLKEAALLFETGSYQQNDYNILVTSPLELRIERVIKRDSIQRQQVLDRIANQLPENAKENLADFKINNNEKEFLIPQVWNLHQKIIKINNDKS